MSSNVLVSVEPVAQQDATGRPRKLQEIDQAGNLIHKEPKNADQKLTQKLHRVWQERGDFNLVSTAELEQDPEYAIKVPEPTEEEAEAAEVDEDGKMTFEAMAKMRGELLQNLNMARNEIWLVFELARTLVASTNQAASERPVVVESKQKQAKKGKQAAAPVEAPPTVEPATASAASEATDPNPLLLPVGSITTSTSINPYQPLVKQIRATQLALATQRQAALKCANMFEDAVKQMQTTNSHSEGYWQNVLGLRNGRERWHLMAKPAFGVHARASGNARDLAIPYALDEAGPSVRSRCLATFSLNHDDAKKSIEYHARRHRRLRCQLVYNNGQTRQVSTAASTGESTAAESLANAQREVFEEEIYAECVAEVRRSEINGCVVLKNSVSVPVSGDLTAVFSTYDTREEVDEVTRPETSPLCDALLASAQLLMLNLYRYRKQRLYARTSGDASTAPKPPRLVQPIIQLLRFKTVASRLDTITSSFTKVLQNAGLRATDRALSSFSGITDWVFTLEKFSLQTDVGIAHVLSVEDCPCITLAISPPDDIRVTLPHATFPVEDLSSLPEILARHAELMLLGWLGRRLKDAAADSFVDELDERLVVGRYSFQIRMPTSACERVEAIALTAGEPQGQHVWRAGDHEKDLEGWARELLSTT